MILPALSVIVSMALLLPSAVGIKLMPMLQVAPEATLPLQVVASAKSPGLAPPSELPVMFRLVLPGLLSTVVWALLLLPSVWFPKVRVLGDSTADGPAITL
jgi:hypothetical protein